jgi:threonine dehydratase
MKIIIEPSSAVVLSAILENKNKFKNKNIALIISGGNVDLNNYHGINGEYRTKTF